MDHIFAIVITAERESRFILPGLARIAAFAGMTETAIPPLGMHSNQTFEEDIRIVFLLII